MPQNTSDVAGDFASIKMAVDEILQLDLSASGAFAQYEERVSRVLDKLALAVDEIRRSAAGYPDGSISFVVWLDGAGLGNLSCALTRHLKAAPWLAYEERASAIWAQAVLAVCSHYHHLVGPAMLANADCQERLGNQECAVQLYTSVVADFAGLAEEWRHEDDPPPEEVSLALESLQTALQRLHGLGKNDIPSWDLPMLAADVQAILERTASISQD